MSGLQNYTYNPFSWQNGMNDIYPGDSFSLSINFFIGLIIVPAIILGVGLLCIFSYQITLCCRCCVTSFCPNWCQCYFERNRKFLLSDFKKRTSYYKYTLIAFAAFWLIVLSLTLLMFLPYQNLLNGYNSTKDAIATLIALINAIIQFATEISTDITAISNAVTDTTCSTAFNAVGTGTTSTINAQTSAVTTAIQALISYISTIPNFLNQASDYLTDTIQPITTKVFWGYFGAVIAALVLWLLVFLLRSKKYLTFMIVIAEIIVVVLTIVYSAEMFLVHLNSSFCSPNPTYNTLNVISGSSKLYTVAQHYLTCKG